MNVLTGRHKCQQILFFTLFVCCFMVSGAKAFAQDTLTIYFPLNKYNFDPSYMGNQSTMEKLLEMDDDDIQAIICRVTSSPEGPESRNNFLSRKRAEAISNWLHANSTVLNNAIEVISTDEAWAELETLVRESDQPWKNDVLELLKIGSTDQRKAQMQKYSNGQIWQWMKTNWFPMLRQSLIIIKTKLGRDIVCIAKVEEPSILHKINTVPAPPFAGIFYTPQAPIQPEGWTPQIHLKINAVGLALGHGNIAAEFDIAPHWSVAIPFYYSGGFDYFKPTIKFRGIVVQPEVRYYFGSRCCANAGFYAAVHAGLGWYNYALDGEYRIQDHKGTTPAWGGGIGLGYAMNFKKAPRWGMEFAIGAGVYKAKYDIFYNEQNGPYSEYGVEKTFIGIDNASVAVTYSFNLKKGGRR